MAFSDRTSALLEHFGRRDHDEISDAGRTKLLLYEETRPVAVLLFHGMSATPQQFARFALDLHARGHNVVVPRLPAHGHRDRFTPALAHLHARDLRAFAGKSIELAQGLGERVVVAGFSLGGLLALWGAQHHAVARAVAIAPFLGISWMPLRLTAPFTDTILRLPNFFGWWNPLIRDRSGPDYGYPRYASHAVAQALVLAREVFAYAREEVAARELIVVTNAAESAVSNRAIRRLLRRLRAGAGCRLEHVVLSGIVPSHDIIEPSARPAIAERVYPQLLEIIGKTLDQD